MGPGPPASPHREKPCQLGRTNSLRQDSLRNNFCLFISGKRILLITLFINLFSLYNFLSLLAKFFMKNRECRQMSADVGNVGTCRQCRRGIGSRHRPTFADSGCGGGTYSQVLYNYFRFCIDKQQVVTVIISLHRWGRRK